MAQTNELAAYEFGPFRLLPLERLLLRDGELVSLTPKVFETLLVLVRNRGTLLSKDDLMKMIWPDTSVEEGNLTQNIFLLRRILGENPKDHQYLVTVPLQGYCFVANVKEIRVLEGADLLPSAPVQQQPLPVTLIAVLPFTLLNQSPGENFEGVGMADTLITKLSNLERLTIRPTAAVLKYTADKEDLVTVGRALRVGAILDGTIQHTATRVRVNVQLVDVNSGTTMWATQYDEPYSGIFIVQDSIATQVARALELRLTGEEQERLGKTHTEDLEAYMLYIKGRHFWDSRTQQGLLKGLDYARLAVAADPQNALAHVAVADSFILLAQYLYLAPGDAFPNAKTAAKMALQLDPDLAEAHASMAEVEFFYDWDWRQASQNYQYSIVNKPNYASAHHWFAWWLMTAGRFDEALDSIRQAQRVDPGSLTLNTVLGLPFYYRKEYERAANQFRTTLEMDSHFPQAHYYLGSALLQLGRYDEAAAHFEDVSTHEYGQQALALLSYTHARSGRTDEANEILEALKVKSKRNYVSPYLFAIIYSGLGDKRRAIDELERAFREKACWMVFLNVDPLLDVLRDELRFTELIRQLKLPTANQT